MRDLAFLSMARTYYSASIKLDENNTPSIDGTKLSAAVKYWNKVDVASEYWLDGALRGVLGVLHGRRLSARAREHPHHRGALFPEVVLSGGRDSEGGHLLHQLQLRRGHRRSLRKFNSKVRADQEGPRGGLNRFKGDNQDEPFFKFLKEVRAGKANLPPTIKPVVEASLSDRQLLRNIEYVRVLDEEEERFSKAPGSFQNSPLGGDVKDGASARARPRGRSRGQAWLASATSATLDELNEHLRNGAKILIDITAAQRNQLDAQIATGQMSKAESKVFGVINPDEEHVIWPFDGEYWRDELGFYRQVVSSKCGR